MSILLQNRIGRFYYFFLIWKQVGYEFKNIVEWGT